MVMRPTNHMISACDHSHNQLTWSRHVTYKLHPDIKSSLIPTSALWLHPSLSSIIRSLYLPIITARIVHCLRTSCEPQAGVLWRPARKTTSRSTPVLESGSGGWIEEKCLRLLQQELDQREVPSILSVHWGSHEWSGKGRRLVGRGLAWLFGTSTSASTMKHYTTR